jgi:hypothetical protein
LVHCQKYLAHYEKRLILGKNRIDLVAFDRASTVQKAADLLKKHIPAVTVIQGVEHTVTTIIGR